MRCHWRDLSADGGMETEMQRFKKIVFALTTTEDDDRTVLDLAELARATNAEVRVVGLNHAQAWPAQQVLDASGWHDDLVEQARAHANAHAARVGERMRELDVPGAARFTTGRPPSPQTDEETAQGAGGAWGSWTRDWYERGGGTAGTRCLAARSGTVWGQRSVGRVESGDRSDS